MALLAIAIPRSTAWPRDARLRLYAGTENAADLAGSTPAGGTLVVDQPAFAADEELGGFGEGGFGDGLFGDAGPGWGFGDGALGDGLFGDNDLPPARLSYRHIPTLRECSLPVGAKVLDADGNESAVVETLAAIADPPRNPRDVVASATVNAGEVKLDWTPSPDV